MKPRRLKGLAVSPGIAVGVVHRLKSEALSIPKFWVADSEIPSEADRFQKALKKVRNEIRILQEKLCKYKVGDHVRILDSHQMITQDTLLVDGTLKSIREDKINAEWAFEKQLDQILEKFPKEDEYFQERAAEIRQIGQKIFLQLMGRESPKPVKVGKDAVIVAHDLSPTDTIHWVRGNACAFITEVGGMTSHTAIVARSLEIPAVCGVDDIGLIAREGDRVLVDGTKGIVLLHPTATDQKRYENVRKKQEKAETTLLREAPLPAVTKDGVRIKIAGNLELPEEIPMIRSHGGEGIGLFRTEILFISQNRIPSEEEQFRTYSEVLKKMSPHPTTIRTLDLGGDKQIAGTEDADEMEEMINPALGLRAIRYGLRHRGILKTQLRAMMRASVHGSLRILIPMITNLDEVRSVKKMLADIRQELAVAKIRTSDNVKLGFMIEVPSAALMADEIAAEADFLSIGTNDLTQYTLAVDRDNDHVSALYEPLHPAVLKLLKLTCEAAQRRRIDVSICGEMAGDPCSFLLLLGLGLTELSMNPVSIPRVKKLTRMVTFRQAKELLDRALLCRTASEIESLVKREAAKIKGFPSLV